MDRHYEYKELSEEELYERAFESPEDIFDAVCNFLTVFFINLKSLLFGKYSTSFFSTSKSYA